MCGRFTLTYTIQELQSEFKFRNMLAAYQPSYNIPPLSQIPIVLRTNEGKVIELRRWGLIPSWVKDAEQAKKLAITMKNARDDTIRDKSTYNPFFTKSRCIIPASGFYEWHGEDGKKQPYYIRLKDNKPMGFAGMTSSWTNPEGMEMQTCAIITTSPNEIIKPIHDRMPVILHNASYDNWLDPDLTDKNELLEFLMPFPSELMEAYKVSTFVNTSKNNGKECIEPLMNSF